MIRRCTTVLAAVATCLALAAPADAEKAVIKDKGGGGLADISKVTVHHTERRVIVKTRVFRDKRLPDEMWHLVDTKGDRTPEFLVFSVVQSEVDDKARAGAYRIDRWPRRKFPYAVLHDGKPSKCGLHKAKRKDHRKVLQIVLGRGCFKIDGKMPKRLRLNTFGTWEFGAITDSVPKWRKYGPWLEAG